MREIVTVQQQIELICDLKGEHELIQAIINVFYQKKKYHEAAKSAEKLLDQILQIKNQELRDQSANSVEDES